MSLIPFLTQWLNSANIYDEAYVEYMVSVLNDEFGNSSEEEKITSIVDFLSSVTENPLEEFAQEALAKWKEDHPQKDEENEDSVGDSAEQNEKPHEVYDEEKRKRDLILQYGEVEDLENEDEGDEDEPNSNAQRVADADAAKREKAKKEHAKKVLNEKELLQRDKERKEERKANRKTQKQERKR